MGSRPDHSTRAHSAPAVKRPWNSPRRLGIWVPRHHLHSLIASLKGECNRKPPLILFVLVVFHRSRPRKRRDTYGQ
jgi:hypothetical protein